jgi:xanthine dehydrogenase/oxidase
MFITETMISEVADKLNFDVNRLRELNMYQEGLEQTTPCSYPIEDWHVPEMWSKIKIDSAFAQQSKSIAEFNASNRWKKRGIALIPSKFPLGLPNIFNQATALVHIHRDGSVLVSHGGVEMGQGLHTKMIQIAANALHVQPCQIFISNSASDRVPNASTSGGSVTTDLNGMAVNKACLELYARLAPFREANPTAGLAKWAEAAYASRVSLSAHGFFSSEDLTYDPKTNTGRMFFYFTNGVAVTSVEIDTLTGDHSILRSDIIMDIGNSINYSIDIGQIEGGFIQGVGWVTSEELLVESSNGASLSLGPRTYKIPTVKDIPRQMNVSVLRGKTYKNLRTIKSSKAIGEPPFFLGASVCTQEEIIVAL